jgi:hypothetical protein
MKSFLAILPLVLGVSAVPTLDEAAKQVPECAFSAFTQAMKDAKCDVDNVGAATIDCMCSHRGSIPIAVSKNVPVECSAGSLPLVPFRNLCTLDRAWDRSLSKGVSIE